jgi:mitogen-activated protein kinase 15
MSLEVDSHVEKRYSIERHIGSGAYGVVWRAVDRKSKQVVALKKVYDGFGNQQDAQRTYREVMLLQRLQHPNIIQLLNVMRAVNGNDLYLAFELMETDLHAVIRSGILQPIHKQFIAYQIVRSVRYLHAREVIHRDLKPANILLNSECVVKMADFGLARTLRNLPQETAAAPHAALTDYIATRWYRSPEVLLGTKVYDLSMDMWAVGCIVAELLLGTPLFRGDSTLNQLSMIVGSLGEPSKEQIEELNAPHADEVIAKLPPLDKPQDSLRHALSGQTSDAVNLITAMLAFSPKDRITANEAMLHPYIAPFCSAEEIEIAKAPAAHTLEAVDVPLPDATRFAVSEYRDALYEDISKSRRELRQTRSKRNLKAARIVSMDDGDH